MMTANLTEKAVAFYKEDILDLESWFRVADIDYLKLLEVIDIKTLFRSNSQSLRLLDVGCGTGRFPELVRSQLPQEGLTVDFDFLDPSAYCVQVMRENLRFPYKADHSLQIAVEYLDNWAKDTGLRYDILWAIHSLYFIDEKKIPDVIQILHGLLTIETGVGLIYLSSSTSFYMKIFDIYNSIFNVGFASYRNAEQIIGAFTIQKLPYREKSVHFNHEISIHDSLLLEKYLHKCVLDDSHPIEVWLQHPELHELIENYCIGEVYRFPQEVKILQFGDIQRNIF